MSAAAEVMTAVSAVLLSARMAPRRPPPPVYDHPRQKSRQVQRAEERAERKREAR